MYRKAPATSLCPSLVLPVSAPATPAPHCPLTCHPPAWNAALLPLSSYPHLPAPFRLGFVLLHFLQFALRRHPSELAGLPDSPTPKITGTLGSLQVLYLTSKHLSLPAIKSVFVYCLCPPVGHELHQNTVLALNKGFLNDWRDK